MFLEKETLKHLKNCQIIFLLYMLVCHALAHFDNMQFAECNEVVTSDLTTQPNWIFFLPKPSSLYLSMPSAYTQWPVCPWNVPITHSHIICHLDTLPDTTHLHGRHIHGRHIRFPGNSSNCLPIGIIFH